MNLKITGHHLTITPAIHDYVLSKIERIKRHSDQVIDIAIIMTVEKLKHTIEANVHLSGKDIFVQAEDENMYAAIDSLADKLNRQIVKNKEKHSHTHQMAGGVKHQAPETDDE
jgi:putative sigma-54 modulation protein